MVMTRQRLTWNSLTPASPIDTGDVVDVLVDGEEPIRGTFCGLHPFSNGRIYASISLDDDAWQFIPLELPHSIRLVRESMSLVIHEEGDRLDAAEPQPGGRAVVCWILAGCLAWAALVLWAFPFWR